MVSTNSRKRITRDENRSQGSSRDIKRESSVYDDFEMNFDCPDRGDLC